jgi:hypothetical protein
MQQVVQVAQVQELVAQVARAITATAVTAVTDNIGQHQHQYHKADQVLLQGSQVVAVQAADTMKTLNGDYRAQQVQQAMWKYAIKS